MYLAICTAVFDDEVYTCTRTLEEEQESPAYLLSSFSMELGLTEEDIDCIIILKNGFLGQAPQIVKNWSAKEGDFDA